MGAYIPYTEEEERIIKEFAGVKSTEEIGLMIGRCRIGVLKKAQRMGVSLRVHIGENHFGAILSDLQVEMIRTLSEAGFRGCEIHRAAFDHVADDTIYSIISFWKRRIR
ncbi:MAG: hypothetical protein COB12_12020 [Flavobacterium sp.]|nr:MAG: hypothetical protein COB12_12020 [Flavobacterium sp.]